jgi:hydrogenase maturation protease
LNLSTKNDTPEARPDWQVVGLGAYLSRDDEIGLALVQSLSQDADFTGRCVLLESSDAATVAASILEWRRPLVLVDAADMKLNPGEHRFFSDRDAAVILKNSSVSTHGLGLAEGLALARTLGFDHPVYIFGIQPFDLSPRQGLTSEMSARFPALLFALKKVCSQLLQ